MAKKNGDSSKLFNENNLSVDLVRRDFKYTDDFETLKMADAFLEINTENFDKFAEKSPEHGFWMCLHLTENCHSNNQPLVILFQKRACEYLETLFEEKGFDVAMEQRNHALEFLKEHEALEESVDALFSLGNYFVKNFYFKIEGMRHVWETKRAALEAENIINKMTSPSSD